jgi:pimeloyl-ACP methyl ester carboxylesterase
MHYSEKILTLTTNNQIVSYIDEGLVNASTIIFIHGFPLNKEMWNKQVGEFKDNYRVIAYDIRGHGKSDSGEEDFSIELFVKDLISLMDVLKIDKTILCGFSMGGYIALNAIENYPERFNALLLCDTNCAADLPQAKDKRMETIESIKEKGVELYAQESLKRLFAPISFSKQIEEISIVRAMIIGTSKESLFKTLYAIAQRAESCTKLHEIKVPVLILVGKDDEITPGDVALAMHKKIKNSTIHFIDRAGHLSNMENPIQFNFQLNNFLKTLK